MSLPVNSSNVNNPVVALPSNLNNVSIPKDPICSCEALLPKIDSLEGLLGVLGDQGLCAELTDKYPVPLACFTKRPLDHIFLGQDDQGFWTVSILNPRTRSVEAENYEDLSDAYAAIRIHRDRVKTRRLELEQQLGDLFIDDKKSFKGPEARIYFCKVKGHYRFIFPKGNKSSWDLQCLLPTQDFVRKIIGQLDTFTAASREFGAKVSLQGSGNPIQKVLNGDLFHVETILFAGEGDEAAFRIFYLDPIAGLPASLTSTRFDLEDLKHVIRYVEKISDSYPILSQNPNLQFRAWDWFFWSEEARVECQSLQDGDILIRSADGLDHFELMARSKARDLPLILPSKSLDDVEQTLELLKTIQQDHSDQVRLAQEEISREELSKLGPLIQVFREIGEIHFVYLDPETGTIQREPLEAHRVDAFQSQRSHLMDQLSETTKALSNTLQCALLPAGVEIDLHPDQLRFELTFQCPFSGKNRKIFSQSMSTKELSDLCGRIERIRMWRQAVQNLQDDQVVVLPAASSAPPVYNENDSRLFLQAKADFSGFWLHFYDPFSGYRVRLEVPGVDDAAIERGLLEFQQARDFLNDWRLNVDGLQKMGSEGEIQLQMDSPNSRLEALLDMFNELSFPQSLLQNDGIPIRLQDLRRGLDNYIHTLKQEVGIPGLPPEGYEAIRNRACQVIALLTETTDGLRAKGLVQLAISALGHCGTRVDRATSDLYRELTGQLFTGSLEEQILRWVDELKDATLRDLIMQGHSQEPGHEYHFLVKSLREHATAPVFLPKSYGTLFGDEYESEGRHRFKNSKEAYQAFRSAYHPLHILEGVGAYLDEALSKQDCQLSSQVLMYLQGYVERRALKPQLKKQVQELESGFQEKKIPLAKRIADLLQLIESVGDQQLQLGLQKELQQTQAELDGMASKFQRDKANILLEEAEKQGLFSWNEDETEIALSSEGKLLILEELGILHRSA